MLLTADKRTDGQADSGQRMDPIGHSQSWPFTKKMKKKYKTRVASNWPS